MVGRNVAYIGIGSNIGDRVATSKKALDLLESESIKLLSISSFYTTSPVGYLKQPDFINSTASLATTLSPSELYEEMVKVEVQLGKNTPFRDGPRVIDLDILLYGDILFEENGLIIPHSKMHLRRFVLEPLSEIAPNLIHPSLKTTVEELRRNLQESSDDSCVKYTGAL